MRVTVLALMLMSGHGVGAMLESSDVKCHGRDGELVRIDKFIKSSGNFNACIECRCLGGKIACEDKSRYCPSVTGCYNLKPRRADQCCRECEDCRAHGNSSTTTLSSGQLLVPHPSSDPCQVSLCFDGVLTQARKQCAPSPGCEGVTPGPNQCCPVCYKSGCLLNGHRVGEGETHPDPGDRCKQCSCHKGGLVCTRLVCPVLSCPLHLQHTPKGACCPQCTRHRTFQTPNHCYFRKKRYNRGEQFQADSCTTCTCTSFLTTMCSRDPDCLPPSPSTQPGARQSCTTSKGTTYSHGQRWSEDKCTTCTCKLGMVECTGPTQCPPCPQGSAPVPPQPGECCPACRKLPPPPTTPRTPTTEGVCTVFGDPHYKTFDGKIFNFQGSCKYLLSKDCSENSVNSSSSFSIRITNDARDTVAFSWLRTITVRLGSTKVSLLQKMRVKVDGKKVNLPFIKLGVLSVMRDGYRVILRTNEGARLLWDGVSFLELTVPPRMRGNMCGLCGNFNGYKGDDLVGRHGALLASGQEFGNSWRVGGTRACSVLPRDVPAQSPACKEDWDSTIRSNKHCAAIKSNLFAACHARVQPEFFFKACRIDMCECPGTQCHCEVLTAYARECERAGIRITRWREETGCKNVKPFKYSGEHLTASLSSGETSATTDVNATLNEVFIGGLDEDSAAEVMEDDIDTIVLLDTARGLQRPAALPAFRSKPAVRGEERGQKRKEREKRRRERKRQRKLKKRLEHEQFTQLDTSRGDKDKPRSLNSIGNYNGFVVKKTGGGAKKRLKWGKGRRRKGEGGKAPPFASLLQAVEDSDFVPHSSGEVRTTVIPSPMGPDTSSQKERRPQSTSSSNFSFKGHRRKPRRRGRG